MGIYIRKERPKYWLVESHREGPKVVQRKLKYLGSNEPTLAELERLKEEFKDRVPLRKRPQPKRNEEAK
jgi:hypothetical protein